MTITLVQHAGADNAGSGISTSQVAFTTSVAIGNTIIVGIGEFDGTAHVSGVVDNIGNTYWRQVTGSQPSNSGQIEVWSAAITAGGTPTIKAIMAATQSGGDFIPISAAEFSGIATASAETSSVATNPNQSSAASSSQVTPNETGALIYGLAIFSAGGPCVAGSGFTLIDQLPNTPDITEYLVTTGSGKIAASCSEPSTDSWIMITAVFTPTAVAPAGKQGFTIQGLNDSHNSVAIITTLGGSLASSIQVT